MTPELLTQGFRAWFAGASGLPLASVLVAGSGVVAQDRPHAIVELTAYGLHGGHRVQEAIGDEEVELVSHERALIEVQVLGVGPEKADMPGTPTRAGTFIANARLGMAMSQLEEDADEAGFAVVEVGPPRNLTALRETRHEERAAMLFTLAYRDSATDTGSGSIERIIGTGTVGGEGIAVDVEE